MSILRLFTRLESMGINLELVDGQLKINAPKGTLTPGLIDEIKDKKPGIIDFFQKHAQKKEKYTSIEPIEEKQYYPLSSAQQRLYFVQQMDPESTVYNMPAARELLGVLDRKRLDAIFRRLIARHDSLRTSFQVVKEEPVQLIRKDAEFEIEYNQVEVKVEEKEVPFGQVLDAFGGGDNEGTRGLAPLSLETAAALISSFIRPFDLTNAPLLRVGLVQLEQRRHILMVDMHHIISDGTSLEILIKELMSLYGEEEPPRLGLQYKDYSQWQKEPARQAEIKRQKEYWKKEFATAGEIPVLNLPADNPRPAIQGFAGAAMDFKINSQNTAALNRLANTSGATLYIVLLAVYTIFLSKLGSQEDIIVGTPVAGRGHARLGSIIGMFVNTLALRNFPAGEKTFTHYLEQVKNRTITAFNHQDCPYEELVEAVAIERDPGRNPLFDTLFVLQNLDIPELEIPGIKIKPHRIEISTAKFDLLLSGIEQGGNLWFSFEYSTNLFEKETIQRFTRFFHRVIAAVTTDNNLKLSQIEIILGDEKKQILLDFNDTVAGYPKDKTIHELFADQVEKTPDNIAVVGPLPIKYRTYMTYMTYISYRDLNEQSNRLAHLLIEKGVGADTIVGIMVERSLEMIVGILGILKAGGAYLPIDPDYPQERIDYMLKDSGAKILLTAQEIAGIYSPQAFKIHPKGTPSHLHLPPVPAISLAYIMYTSGTTNKAKGVMVEHKSAARLVINTNYVELTNETRILQTGAPVFDATTFEIWGALLHGGQLVLVSNDIILEADKLGDSLAKHKINTLWLSSPLFNQLMQQNSDIFTGLEYLLVGGDVLSPPTINKVRNKNKGLQVINGYGPTENTTFSTTYLIDKDFEKDIPIGKPINNSTAYILDRHGNLQPIGLVGELVLGGDGTARGYLNSPGLTAEKFERAVISHSSLVIRSSKSFPNDQCPMTNDRLYRTGDLARWRPEGNIEFLGRLDHQVKIRGYRIEMGEIEKQLLKHNQIKDAVVIDQGDGTGNKYLCAYVVFHSPHSSHMPGSSELKKFLSQSLPHYMIPLYFLQIHHIPLTSNGKLDRKALPVVVHKPGDDYTPPGNEIEKKLVDIWSDILSIDKGLIGINDNFFDLGGHSLNATILVSRIHRDLSIKMPLQEVFRRRTIKGLAGYLQQEAKTRYAGIEPVEKREYYPLSSAQKRLYFLQHMDLESTAYNMPLALHVGKEIDKDAFETALKKLIARHESLRTSFIMVKDIPYQEIHDKVEFEIEYYKVEVKVEEERSSLLEGTRGLAPLPTGPAARSPQPAAALISSFIRPFDLSRAPLIRSGLVKHPDNHYTWIVDIHHIVSDGTSHMILADDFKAFYAENGKGLEPLKLHYKDFSQWQNRLIESGGIRVQENYWLNLYADAKENPRLNLHTDYKRPPVFTFAGDYYEFTLGRETAAAFKARSARRGGTLYMSILAVLNTLFYKYTGQTDIIIGTGVAGRPHAELQRIIGMFVNMLGMRNYPEGEKTYESLLKEVISRSVAAFENQDIQFEELVDRLDVQRDPSRNPLFDIAMVVQNFKPLGEGNAYPITVDILAPGEYRNSTAKFDMTFFMFEQEGDIHIIIEYYTGIFKEETVIRLSRHFRNIIGAVVANSSLKLKDIGILSEEEKQQVLHRFNDTAAEYPWYKTIHRLFAEQVEKTPDRIAAEAASAGYVTYSELEQKSNRLARYLLHTQRIQTDGRVGILLNSSMELAGAVLGILKAGAAYVPLDPSLPEERIKYMINDAGIAALISEKKYIKTLNRLQWECPGFHRFLCVDSFNIHQEDEVEKSELMNEELWNHVAETAVDDITGGGWLSSYTGEPFSRLEMDEYGDNIFKKLEPLLFPKMRVLEIGCASGITMYRIASRVGLYYGTDLSHAIIEKNRARVNREGLQNIKQACVAAHKIDELGEGHFDLVIINSVIQCFHGHNYLRKVIKKCIDLLGEKGYLFIGDVMDLQKKDALVREMTAFKNARSDKNYMTKADFSTELFMAREFWTDLCAEFKEAAAVQFSGKIYTIENEMTKFRYDTLITVNKEREWTALKKVKHQDDLRVLSSITSSALHLNIPSGSLAYIIYTSGTTGKPKGVEVEHRGVVNMLLSRRAIYEMDPGVVSLQLFSYAFDGYVAGFFTPLISGAKLVLLEREELGNIENIRDAVVRHGVTHFISVPSLFFALVESVPAQDLSSLRSVALAGERMSGNAAAGTAAKAAALEIVNEYGVTEASVMSTIYRHQERDDVIKIGGPIRNTRLYILDGYYCLRPVGTAGELFIAGDGLARGYLNRPELTAEKFNRDLWNYRDDQDENEKFLQGGQGDSFLEKSPPGRRRQKIYKTGDLARWLPDGNIEFLGRNDRQVKIRGFRIELGEIENCLLKHSLVKEAVVIDRGEGSSEKYLCAYTVPKKTLDNTEVREFLARTLPGYMIPAYFVQLDKIPLTANGKVERKALPSPEVTVGEKYVPPRNALEKKLVEIWSEVLGVASAVIGVTDNFFELGGHSLRATVLTSKIQEELKVKVPLAQVFQRPTIRELARYIQTAAPETQTAVEAVEKKDYYPLSSAQTRFYILQQFTPGSTAYNMTSVYRVEGKLETGKFERSVKRMIQRHETLRTFFQTLKGQPVQRVQEEVEFQIRRHTAPAGRHTEIIRDFVREFDLTEAPLLRLGLINISPNQHLLMFDMHHIITDGTSMSLFLEEFMTLYQGGEPSPLPLQYKDFSQWQHDQLTAGKLEKQREYWQKQYPGEHPVLNMPTDFPRPPEQAFDGDKFHFIMEKSLTGRLKHLIKETGTTLYMFLLAVYNILLSRYAGQEDIVIGTTIAGRHHPDLQKIIGLMIETLVQRNFPAGHLEFITFLEMVKQETLAAHENQAYPFREVIRMLGADNEVSRNPVFDAMLIVQNFEAAEFQLAGLRFSPYQPGEKETRYTSKVDITIEAMEIGEEIHITVEYCTRLYKRETMERLARHFINIIHELVAKPAIKLRDLEVIDEIERKLLLETFNDTTHKTGKGKPGTVLERFQGRVRRHPDRMALVGKGQRGKQEFAVMYLTYKELNEKAGRLASLIKEKGAGPDMIVAIMMESSIEMAVTIWGILKAGAAYMPIDPEIPQQRLEYILKDSGAKILLSEGSHPDCLNPLSNISREDTRKEGRWEDEKIGSWEKTGKKIRRRQRTLLKSFGSPEPFFKRVLAAGGKSWRWIWDFPASLPSSLAYIIYTSGTSGFPKGVLVEHRNLANYVNAVESEIQFREDEIVLQQGSLCFDAFVEEFYPALVNGGRTAIPGKILVRDIPGLSQFIGRHRVTMIASAPQMVNELNKTLRQGIPGTHQAKKLLSSLRIVLVGGDIVKFGYIDQFLETAAVYNTYGPTESTVCATYYQCLPADRHQPELPIGKPLARYKIYIFERNNNLAPIGVPGELCVAGPGITRGYMNRPGLTAEKFCHRQPGGALFEKTAPPGPPRKNFSLGSIKMDYMSNRSYKSYKSYMSYIYRTGDLARWQLDGKIEFFGRIDRQVKIRGYRIELEEIETRLTRLNNIKEAVVIVGHRKSGENFLAAYVVGKGEIEAAEIKRQLSLQLPEYMVPPYITAVEAIPWTPLGKVDRERLPQPDAGSRPGTLPSDAAPATDREKQLAKIWTEILERESVGIDDNFFDLGGTSLDIMKLNTRIKEEFKKQIPVVSLFKYTTIRSLAQFLFRDGERDKINNGEVKHEQEQKEILEAIAKGQNKLKMRIQKEPREQERENTAQTPARTGLEIAVLGMAGIFPGARNLEEYWENLKNGVEGIHFFADEELIEDGVDAASLENNYIKARGMIQEPDRFDAAFFGYTPLEARIMDPQMRVFQQCVWHALEDAGYDPFSYNLRIGLYAGGSSNFYWEGLNIFANINRGLSGFMVAQLVDKDFMCTHISYKLDLKGPAYSVQTACSTALTAIHLAVRGLLHGECEMALAGGVALAYPQKRGYVYQEGMIFSSDGHHRSFDAKASGSVFGDGAGVVLLKELDQAIADRDHIYAVIKSTATNNDGIRKIGYTAPSIQGQMEVIRGAQLMAEVEPGSITLLEAHGTATPLGDTVELEALKQAFQTGKKGYCAIGTVKSNVGHLNSASGAAGFIKAVLALKNRMIPPTLHFQTANPQLEFENSPFYVNTTLKEWKSNDGSPLRAGVSSFGIGGTNAHIVLEEFPGGTRGLAPLSTAAGQDAGRMAQSADRISGGTRGLAPLTGEHPSRKYQLMLLSAKTPTALDKMTENLVEYFKKNLLNPGNHENPTNPDPTLADMAYTLQVGRQHLPYRRMLVSPTREVDIDRFALYMKRIPTVLAREENRPIVFMFCGQGSQYVNMGIDLYRTEPIFREEMDQCFEILNPLVDVDLKEILYPGERSDRSDLSDQSDLIHQTEITQPLVFAFEYALAKLLIRWGIKPWAMIGYSFGEYIAACISGVFSLEDALKLVITRGRLTQRTPTGAMISVPLPEEKLKPLLNKDLSLAIVNGPTCIVSGKKEDVEDFEKEMKQKRMICVPLNMSHAVHSPVMNPIRRDFEQKIGQFRLNEPQIPFISNVTARWSDAGEVTSPGYWGDHLCSTVRFSDGVKELLKQENAVFIEIGPGRILGMMVRIHPDKKPGHMILNTVKHPQERVADDYFLLEKLGQLWQHGQAVDWAGFYGEEKRRRVSLPGYPFEGKRYWIDQKDITFGGGLPEFAPVPEAAPVQEGADDSDWQTHDETTAPRSQMETVIARMWKELMGLDSVGIHDDFFRLNGSSLVATQLIARLMQEYDMQIPMTRFYEQPTVAHLAEVIRELQEQNDRKD